MESEQIKKKNSFLWNGILLSLFFIECFFIGDELFNFTPFAPPTLEILFTGEKGQWTFTYPGLDGQLNTEDDFQVKKNSDLFLPKNTKIRIHLHSKDFLYCLTIPELDLTEIAIPDKKFFLEFKCSSEQIFSLESGAICGIFYPELNRKILIKKNSIFQEWQNQFQVN